MNSGRARAGFSDWERVAIRGVPVLLVAALFGLAALGVREIVNSSKFQFFGDFVARVETTEHVVALTFDDGPHPRNTVRMLDLLDQHQVTATFFMMGRNVERHPAIAREVLARGHEVGNHSYSHPKLVLMSPGRVQEEIARTDRLLRDVGVTGEIHFRAPHASKFLVLPYVLTRMGKLSVQGDVDPAEWKRRPPAVMIASVLQQVRPGSIIGFHDTQGDPTLETVDSVLATLIRQGYRFETVSELVKRRARLR
jgi:peptidoglycan/xylan/chitin deacetylase (PgdA/CDA1 family)